MFGPSHGHGHGARAQHLKPAVSGGAALAPPRGRIRRDRDQPGTRPARHTGHPRAAASPARELVWPDADRELAACSPSRRSRRSASDAELHRRWWPGAADDDERGSEPPSLTYLRLPPDDRRLLRAAADDRRPDDPDELYHAERVGVGSPAERQPVKGRRSSPSDGAAHAGRPTSDGAAARRVASGGMTSPSTASNEGAHAAWLGSDKGVVAQNSDNEEAKGRRCRQQRGRLLDRSAATLRRRYGLASRVGGAAHKPRDAGVLG